MKLKVFENQNKNELSMIEVAGAILEERGEVIPFADLVNEIQEYLGKSDKEIRDRLPQFYTDLNNDGSFISMGENVWGLRKWYAYDSIDEEVNHPEDSGEESVAQKSTSKVNAFLSDDVEDDDVIDYDDDDDDDSEEEAIADKSVDITKFSNSNISSIDDEEPNPDDELTDGIEGQLTEFDEDEVEVEESNEDDLGLTHNEDLEDEEDSDEDEN